MPMPAAMMWVLTITFALTGGYHLARCGHFIHVDHGHPVSAWASELARLAMSIAMISMLWSTASWDRWDIQVTGFAVVAGWFAVRAFVGPPAGGPHLPMAGRPALLHESLAFVVMCWMSLRAVGPSPTVSVRGHGAAVMDMPGVGLAPTLTTTIAVGLAVALVAGAGGWAWQLRNLVGAAGKGPLAVAVFGPAGEAACQVAMAAGMVAAALGVML